ncbi:hypothetical protein [Kitasatospora sp. NPDC050463]|uniref:hypothetical protein n=1 Tax=Kitasatospora sp. NPDC050463 TaxID=3155786 RepID=UPI00340DE1C9
MVTLKDRRRILKNRLVIAAVVASCVGAVFGLGSLTTPATAAAQTTKIVQASGNFGEVVTATCPDGYHLTGGGGDANGNALVASRPSDDGQSWRVLALARGVAQDTRTEAWAICSESEED